MAKHPADDRMKNRNYFGFLFDLLFPRLCLNCGAYGDWLCRECSHDGFADRLSGLALPGCDSLDRLAYLENFNDRLVSQMVKTCKYRGIRDLATIMGEQLAVAAANDLAFRQSAGSLLLMPVPLYARRWRTRGFNQSELIAAELGRHLGVRTMDGALKRIKATDPQARLEREQRLANLGGCFAYSAPAGSAVPDTVVLIDDVVTTGATFNEAARVLKQSGVRTVWALAYAHGL